MAKPRRGIPLESETAWYVLLNVCDILATWALLRRDPRFIESNPIARWFYHGWGINGMVWFKLSMVALVVVIAQVIARKNEPLARMLLLFGCAAVGVVFVYSYWLGTHA
jgi:hypothetical protein